MDDILTKNKHQVVELARVAIALRRATSTQEKQGLEDLMVYLALELEKRAHFNYYYDLEKPEKWWDRAVAQFRIGEKVAEEMRTGRQNPGWVKERVEFWVDHALQYYGENLEKSTQVHSHSK